jgi:toxin ParE1/3/4
MTVRFTRRARNDLRDILEYIAKENPATSDRLRGAFLDAINLVGTRPDLGIRNPKIPGLRSRLVTRFPYRIHYRVQNDAISRVHIRHSARRPWNGEN